MRDSGRRTQQGGLVVSSSHLRRQTGVSEARGPQVPLWVLVKSWLEEIITGVSL